MAFLIHLIISIFNFGERVGHVLTGKIKQEGGSSVIAVCAFEVVYQEIPADNGFLLGREVGDDVHFFFVLKVLVGFFLPDTEYPKVFPAERRQQEEIYHLFLVLRKFAFRRINVQICFLASATVFSTAISLLRLSCCSNFSTGESCFSVAMSVLAAALAI